jgi:hypothetical protein
LHYGFCQKRFLPQKKGRWMAPKVALEMIQSSMRLIGYVAGYQKKTKCVILTHFNKNNTDHGD